MELVLHAGKETAVLHHHHWIFSGAVSRLPEEIHDGQIVDVVDSKGTFLAQAYINRKSSLIARVISFDHDPIEIVLQKKISAAWEFRKELFNEQTTAYRIINSEGDGIPGLIIDRYANVLVIQSTTLGIDLLLPQITPILRKVGHSINAEPWSIYVKSTSHSRHEEGLQEQSKWVTEPANLPIKVQEDGLHYHVDPETSQKTGLFLDQREMRRLVTTLANNKTVLNCFSYTGGFSLAALKGNANHVTSVDISREAITQLETNLILNTFDPNKHTSHVGDVFEFLQSAIALDYQLVILDPPAFAKRQSDVPQAMRAYRQLNSLAMSKMPPHTILVTSSCSYHIDPTLFQKLLFQAADQAQRNVRILERHRLAMDHPINIYHPEGEYLKSLVLYIE